MTAPIDTSGDVCRAVELPTGEVLRVRGRGVMTDRDREAMAELVEAARRRFAAENGNLAGRVYLERGTPVEVVQSWGPGGGPRNVAIRRPSGETVVRPFRGLRRQR